MDVPSRPCSPKSTQDYSGIPNPFLILSPAPAQCPMWQSRSPRHSQFEGWTPTCTCDWAYYLLFQSDIILCPASPSSWFNLFPTRNRIISRLFSAPGWCRWSRCRRRRHRSKGSLLDTVCSRLIHYDPNLISVNTGQAFMGIILGVNWQWYVMSHPHWILNQHQRCKGKVRTASRLPSRKGRAEIRHGVHLLAWSALFRRDTQFCTVAWNFVGYVAKKKWYIFLQHI